MIKGVTPKEEIIIKSILEPYQADYDFYYYGSRVKGDFTRGSDLDILLKNETEVPYSLTDDLKTEFNESLIPYIVNVSVYSNMDKNFYKLIEPSLVKII